MNPAGVVKAGAVNSGGAVNDAANAWAGLVVSLPVVGAVVVADGAAFCGLLLVVAPCVVAGAVEGGEEEVAAAAVVVGELVVGLAEPMAVTECSRLSNSKQQHHLIQS